ncbi:grasp-with-spasm system SPASM domain peptide maturase [Chryseobacterium mucoviscidosis]|uniref:grasp-with-spasm system SPASM domain peptide maturase n=1 Tax=Chryseobacterium mucoviscidosis TaxID=1945581 RepID=UPI0031E43E42
MTYLKLFANCLIVLGIKNAVICDLQKNESELIPIEIGKVLQSLNAKTSLEDILANYNDEEASVVNEYIHYIIGMGFGFYCDLADFDLFPNLEKKYEVPYKITNAIIERSRENIVELGRIVDELESLDCQHISVVFYDELSQRNFIDILDQFHKRKLKSFDIVSKWSLEIDKSFLKTAPDNIQLSHLSFFGVPTEFMNHAFDDFNFGVFFSKKNITNFSHCGRVNAQSFNTNLPKVLEAINFNSCLYKKITIDLNGNIKNCPSMSYSFGNVKDVKLEEALNNDDFKKYWNIKKDLVNICKECEFRYICTDCRAYTERTHFDHKGLDISKPLKCGYDPYTGNWEEWSENPLKRKAIKYYNVETSSI